MVYSQRSVIAGVPVVITTENFDGTPAPFTDELTGEPVDPTTVVFSYTVNGGEPTYITYTGDGQITRLDTGMYQVSVPTVDDDGNALAGTWTCQWAGSGSLDAVSMPLSFYVTAPGIDPPFPS